MSNLDVYVLLCLSCALYWCSVWILYLFLCFFFIELRFVVMPNFDCVLIQFGLRPGHLTASHTASTDHLSSLRGRGN